MWADPILPGQLHVKSVGPRADWWRGIAARRPLPSASRFFAGNVPQDTEPINRPFSSRSAIGGWGPLRYSPTPHRRGLIGINRMARWPAVCQHSFRSLLIGRPVRWWIEASGGCCRPAALNRASPRGQRLERGFIESRGDASRGGITTGDRAHLPPGFCLINSP